MAPPKGNKNALGNRGNRTPSANRAASIVAAAELVAARLVHHAHRFSDADLNKIGAALRSATGSVEAEFTRRVDKEDEEDQ